MDPCVHVHVITLAVDDLQRALTFYRDGLGLPTNGVVADEFEGSDTEAAGAIVISGSPCAVAHQRCARERQ
jgi:catechol 2,3-dioxygenase-like lactoylglutathione lyase family enzyme